MEPTDLDRKLAIALELPLAPYSRLIEFAWLVVEAMRARGFRECVVSTQGRDYGATFSGLVGKRWRKFPGYADTAPEAICLAALAATEASK